MATDPLEIYDELRMSGQAPDPEAFAAKYPKQLNLLSRIRKLEELHEELDQAVTPSKTTIAWPKKIGGYKLGRMLGEGGMGAVFEAGSVAIKLLRDPSTLERFEREAQLGLTHPVIARVLHFGIENDQAYMVTELVHGKTLRGVQEKPEIVVEWGLALCDALAYAHARQVIHRDIKPSNIMLSITGEVKLIDFGLAFHREQALTRSGVFLGSHNYAAPEQLETDRAAVGPWTDVYGLGATLYELLAGHRAFDYPTFGARMLAADKKAAPLKDVPSALSKTIMRALEPKVEKRFADMAAFAHGLA